MRHVPSTLATLALLGIARLLPADGFGLWLRLAAATLLLLLPGALIARALGQRGAAAALAWSLAGLFGASLVMFAVHGPIWLALGLYAGMGLAALPLAARGPKAKRVERFGLVLLGGAVFGLLLWHVAPSLDGDALFHMARVRKLEAFGSLSLSTVDEFKDGGLHPGYAFPLWHVLLALVAEIGGVDPASVFRHEASVLTPIALLVAYEAGVAVFRSAWAGFAAMLAQVTTIALAPGNGGAYTSLALPATAARQLLVPAALALFFAFVTRPGLGSALAVSAAGLALAVVHPTYALFLAIPLAGYVVARALFARVEIRRGVAGLGALLLPFAAFGLWLLPLVRDTASTSPSEAERLRGLAKYADQLDVYSAHRFRLAPEVFSRTGAVAIAALVLIPLAALASRRRWAALVVGGSLAVLAVELWPVLFSHFSDAVSLSQSRRAAGFLPFAFAFAGGAAVLARLLGWLLLPIALAAGIVLQIAYPGNFLYGGAGGPALAAWIAAYGGAAALVAGALLSRKGSRDRRGMLAALAAAVFLVPVAVDGISAWSPRTTVPEPLSQGLIGALRSGVPKGSVVFSDDETSYRIAAYAPVYVASALPGHVADTEKNRPYERRDDARRFFRSGDLSIPRSYRARYLVVDRHRSKLPLDLPVLYRDSRYVLYRL